MLSFQTNAPTTQSSIDVLCLIGSHHFLYSCRAKFNFIHAQLLSLLNNKLTFVGISLICVHRTNKTRYCHKE